MSKRCRNPECVNGQTPGIVISGKGNAKVPVLGQTMRWGWVRCLACNPSEDQRKAGAQYRHVARSEAEIAQRAELANSKAPYKQEAVLSKSLARAKPAAKIAEGSGLSDEKINKLLEQVAKLTEQVSELLTENRELRKQLESKS